MKKSMVTLGISGALAALMGHQAVPAEVTNSNPRPLHLTRRQRRQAASNRKNPHCKRNTGRTKGCRNVTAVLSSSSWISLKRQHKEPVTEHTVKPIHCRKQCVTQKQRVIRLPVCVIRLINKGQTL
ncbi:hypothetical protein [Neptuniibacter halophilus]|uniref:hypothetical protein n=1 Tax=Neptuniibacter halophilus TaxID=651666 RepID=UPI002572FD4C|nr:hypothetical protein [Neptuniibacter halophilus]